MFAKTVRWISLLILLSAVGSAMPEGASAVPEFVSKVADFPNQERAIGLSGIGEILRYRASQEPFLVIASGIFLLAIFHTFFAIRLTQWSHTVQKSHEKKIRKLKVAGGQPAYATDVVSFKATLLHFLGEVEAIFGIWALALLGTMACFYDLPTMTSYVMTVNFTEPLFVVIIMALASTRPVLNFAEQCLRFFARFGKESPAAWWLAIMVIAPLLGSFITEPGAMTIAAMLLAKKFYALKPSPKFAYATLGLLFVNISVGGVLTSFAAPPVLMVAQRWGLTTLEMLVHFGDKAVVSILISSLIYYVFFRNELRAMADRAKDHDGDGLGDLIEEKTRRIPRIVTLIHLIFMAWTVAFAHYPPLFFGGFLFFLAFCQGTAHHQDKIQLRGPILVGFFLGGLVVHGGLQGWWLAPIVSSLSELPLFIGATVLTSFNDNAAITFLASQVEGLTPALKYAVLTGAITGGGLTVIANAPNPAGQALLARFFGDGVSPLKLALAALVPTLIVSACMLFFPDRGIEGVFAPEKAQASPISPH
jgi:hypothetical protein